MEPVRDQGRLIPREILLVRRVVWACLREYVARKAPEAGTEEVSRLPIQDRREKGKEEVPLPYRRGLQAAASKSLRPFCGHRMMDGASGMSALVHFIHSHVEVGSGSAWGPRAGGLVGSVAYHAVRPQPTETYRDTCPAEGAHPPTLALLSPGDTVT